MGWAENIFFDSDSFILDVSRFDFPDQGITCIWGASGSGKSTFIQCMAGLIPHDKFKLSVGEDLISELPLRERNVGFVFQDFALFPHMNVWQNIAFAAEAKGLAEEIWKDHANQMIEKLGLRRILKQSSVTLSGGEQQRVALARALITKPRLVLLDEPLSALDEKAKNDARQLISELSRIHKIPFILVTHDLRDVRAMASHILVLAHGQMIGSGTCEKVLNDPPDLDLALLIPENQILNVILKNSQILLAGYKLTILRERKGQGSPVIIAKQWSFEVSQEPSGIKGILLESTDSGEGRQCLVQLSDGQILRAISKMPIGGLKTGSSVDLKVDESSLILFK